MRGTLAALAVFFCAPNLALAQTAAQQADQQAWVQANKEGCTGYRRYLNDFPAGRYVEQARTKVTTCPDPEAAAKAAAAERKRLEAAAQKATREAEQLRADLARADAARRDAERRALEETRKREAAEKQAAAKTAPAAATPAPVALPPIPAGTAGRASLCSQYIDRPSTGCRSPYRNSSTYANACFLSSADKPACESARGAATTSWSSVRDGGGAAPLRSAFSTDADYAAAITAYLRPRDVVRIRRKVETSSIALNVGEQGVYYGLDGSSAFVVWYGGYRGGCYRTNFNGSSAVSSNRGWCVPYHDIEFVSANGASPDLSGPAVKASTAAATPTPAPVLPPLPSDKLGAPNRCSEYVTRSSGVCPTGYAVSTVYANACYLTSAPSCRVAVGLTPSWSGVRDSGGAAPQRAGFSTDADYEAAIMSYLRPRDVVRLRRGVSTGDIALNVGDQGVYYGLDGSSAFVVWYGGYRGGCYRVSLNGANATNTFRGWCVSYRDLEFVSANGASPDVGGAAVRSPPAATTPSVDALAAAFAGTWTLSTAGTGSCGSFPWTFEKRGAEIVWKYAGSESKMTPQAAPQPTMKASYGAVLSVRGSVLRLENGTTWCEARRAS